MTIPLTDAELAADLAEAAGALLLEERATGVAGAAALGKAGDARANRFLVDALRAHRPHDGLLSEEMLCDGARLSHARVWIVDPVDGTREYGERRGDWAVHVGLATDGVAMVGAVALPDAGRLFRSDQPQPLTAPADPLRIVVSRTRAPHIATLIAEASGATLISMGSAGAKAMAVVSGAADAYVHTGGQYEWDSCAPVAVARACGLHCSRLDGSPLTYNARDPYLPDLLICHPTLAERLLRLVAEHESASLS